jgi:hypothetical protein
MRSDAYQIFVKTLNASEAYPPFQEIHDLVMQQTGRRKAAFAPFYRYAAVAALFAALGLFIGNHFLTNKPLPNARIINGSHVTYATDGPTSMNIVILSPKNPAMQGEALKTDIANNTSEKQNASATPQHTTVDAATPPSNANAVQAIVTPTVEPSVPATLAQISNQKEMANDWSGFVSGGSIVPSSSFSTSSFFGAAGVRYQILGSSSLVVELRHSSFIVNHAAQSGAPRDTTFMIDGHAYSNTIGGSLQAASTATSLINSLDVGYRFDLNPNDVLSPCAEILAGASTSGFLSSEAAGLEYRFANLLSLDVSARAEQLFSPQSVPLTALGFEAGVGFEW